MAVTTILPVDCDRGSGYLWVMKHISILALKHATLTSIDGTFHLLSRMNDFLKYHGKKPFYKVEIVGVHQTATLNGGLYNINVHRQIKTVRKTDLAIVPITCGDFHETIKLNRAYADWLIDQYHKGAEIASLCVGAFFLASTGLLDNKECATHWAISNDFKSEYPKVKMMDEKIITHDRGIYTSGGNYSFLNLLLYIVEKDLGKEMAILASKMFEIDMERKTQTEFFIFRGQKQHGDRVILPVQEFIERNFEKDLSVTYIAEKFTVGRRTLERKFKTLTGNSVFEYVQRVRVEAAKKLLEEGKKTISEVVYDSGYNDMDAFRKTFKKYAGMPMGDYAKKYR